MSEYKTMINNMAVYLYFYKNGREKRNKLSFYNIVRSGLFIMAKTTIKYIITYVHGWSFFA